MNTSIFLVTFSVLTIIYFFVGLHASKTVKNTTDYFLASKNLGFFAVTFTLIATQIGGGFFMGMSEAAYKNGYFGVFYALGMSIGFLLLSCGFASRIHSMNVATTAEIFQTRYKSIFLKKCASLLSIATMSGILIGQIVASKELLKSALGTGSLSQFIFVFLWILIIGYTILGGLKAVVMTDIFQVSVILIVFWAIFLYSLTTTPSQWFFTDAVKTQALFPLSYRQILLLLPTLIMPALFSLIEQDLAQRFFAARDKRIASLSALGAGIALVGCALIPVYFGMMTKIQNLVIIPGASPLLPSIASITNSGVLALVFCGLLAAITSTADALLCAISSNVSQDFDFSWITIKDKLRFSQIVTCITGCIAFMFSYFFNQNIIAILSNSYEISVSALFVSLIFAYFKKDLSSRAAYLSVISGFSAFIFFQLYTLVGSSVIILGISLGGYLLGMRFDNNKKVIRS